MQWDYLIPGVITFLVTLSYFLHARFCTERCFHILIAERHYDLYVHIVIWKSSLPHAGDEYTQNVRIDLYNILWCLQGIRFQCNTFGNKKLYFWLFNNTFSIHLMQPITRRWWVQACAFILHFWWFACQILLSISKLLQNYCLLINVFLF